ncbi:uncharacterized protein LOC141849689 isoform X2 [Brevipalpus obovatus]|uniref:uncharacterized protein LOC141849689 isoform X2 n=1 Tax=Brevipalpus obovatus TaxID=246614 RepID=UPI003D9F009D
MTTIATISNAVSSQSLLALSSEKDNLGPSEDGSYELLKKKKQALEDALHLKVMQLKSLCLKEAEMTGVLPPETPLMPGEPIPQVRKRVGAEFNINQNLLHKAKSLEEENLARLELELELQHKIVKANLKLCNEVKLKRSVRKKRLQSYQDAVRKLKELEKHWLNAREKVEETPDCSEKDSIYKDKSKSNFNCNRKGSVSSARPKSSLALAPESDTEQITDSVELIAGKSAPSTPSRFHDPNDILRACSPPPNISDFISISAKPGPQFGDTRPSSVHFPFEKGVDENEPERCKTAEHFSREFDVESWSIGSTSSTESSVFKLTNGSKRKNILSLLQPHGSFDMISSHLYSMPSARASTTSSLSFMDSISQGRGAMHSNDHLHQLTRHDSLERARRKSYVSAIQAHQPLTTATFDEHLYQNQDSLTDLLQEQPLPPPPDLLPTIATSSRTCLPSPPPLINMASRPLPSPPTSSSSVSSSSPSPPFPSPSSSTTRVQQHYRSQPLQHSHSYETHDCRHSIQKTHLHDHPQHSNFHLFQPSETFASSHAPVEPSFINQQSNPNGSRFEKIPTSDDSLVQYNNSPSDDLYQNVPDFRKATELKRDISSRAVRSHIIRTPIVPIAISNSSADISHVNQSQPTPPPSCLPSKIPDSSSTGLTNIINGSATMSNPYSNHVDLTYAAKSIIVTPDPELSPSSIVSPAKTWKETDLDSYVKTSSSSFKTRKAASKSGKTTPAPCNTMDVSYNASNTSNGDNRGIATPSKCLDNHDCESVSSYQLGDEANEVDIIMSRAQSGNSNSTTSQPPRSVSRPLSIPLSPNLPPPSNGVEVNIVSVGLFQPYWEETKPYELSDFYKYSSKHRSKAPLPNSASSSIETSSNCGRGGRTVSPSSSVVDLSKNRRDINESELLLRKSEMFESSEKEKPQNTNWYEKKTPL